MDRESQEMNNKINFDSEKYRSAGENTRPATTIENLNTGGEQGGQKGNNVKRTKCTNIETGGGQGST